MLCAAAALQSAKDLQCGSPLVNRPFCVGEMKIASINRALCIAPF